MLKVGDLVEIKMHYPSDICGKKGVLVKVNPYTPQDRAFKVLVDGKTFVFSGSELVILKG